MKLFWVKSGNDILVGEAKRDLSDEGIELTNPMALQYINIPQQSKVLANGRQPEMVTGFKFITIPCSEIFVERLDWHGEVKKHDPVYVTYYKVLEAIKKQADDPLMVAQ